MSTKKLDLHREVRQFARGIVDEAGSDVDHIELVHQLAREMTSYAVRLAEDSDDQVAAYDASVEAEKAWVAGKRGAVSA